MYRVLWILGCSIVALLLWGFIVLASASSAGTGGVQSHGFTFYVTHQCVWLVVALLIGLVAAFLDYRVWRRNLFLTISLYVFVAVLLVLLVPPVAHLLHIKPVKGSFRWIDLGFFKLQPSELAKLVTVLATAAFLDRAGVRINKFWKGALAAAGLFGIFMALTLSEPDLGSTSVIGATGLVLLLVGGVRYLHLFFLALMGAAAIVGVLVTNTNRMMRLCAWLPARMGGQISTWLHLPAEVVDAGKAENAKYQLHQSLNAFIQGGVTGVGFNQSRQKAGFLPEARTDFIFAVGAEEFGLIFSIVLLSLFIVFFVCGMIIAARANDRFGKLVAYGMSFLLFFQALCNIGVVTGCLPTKGLAMPFISYGGTNLVVAMVAVGFIFNVGRQIELQTPRPRSTISPVFSTQGV